MSNKKYAYIYLIITLCAWGSLYVVSKFILTKVPTFTVLFFRYLISVIILFAILNKRKVSKIEKKDFPYIFLIGFIGYFISIAAQFIGTKLSNASTASLINSTNPIFIILFAVLILKEKLTLKKIICVILALFGTFIIIHTGNTNGGFLGILFSICSVISWSFMSVIVKKITQKYDSIQVTSYALFVALIFSAPCSIYEFFTVSNIDLLDLNVVLSLLYIGLICTALSHVLWNKSLSMLEASSCSLFYPIQPMISALLGFLFLNENIDLNFIFGSILIIAGILFSIEKEKTIADNVLESHIN